MLSYKKTIINEKAHQYFLDHLENGKYISSSFNLFDALNKGTIFSYYPKKFNESMKVKFRTGGLIDPLATYKIKVKLIENYLQQAPNNTILFENSSASKSDDWLKYSKTNKLFYENDVYHYLGICDIDNIELTLDEASNAWSNNIFFIRLPVGVILEPNLELTKSVFDEFINNIDSIITDAYDLDGFLVLELYK